MAYIELSSSKQRFDFLHTCGDGSQNVQVWVTRIVDGAAVHPLRAVKKLLPVSSKESKTWRRCEEECRRLERLSINNYANIVRVHNYGLILRPDDNELVPFIEMDYIKGDTIYSLVDHHRFIDFRHVADMARDISSALALCHHDIVFLAIDPDTDGYDPETDPKPNQTAMEALQRKYRVIHNDIHPGNIMRHSRFPGDTIGEYVLIDFGLSVENDDGNLTLSLTNNCPAPFRAPEKWVGDIITPATDVYNFGCVLYYYLAGTPPFIFTGRNANDQEGHLRLMRDHQSSPVPPIFPRRRQAYRETHPDSPEMTAPDYPAWFEDMIRRCLEKKPEDRFADGRELFNFIHAHLHSAPAPSAAAPAADHDSRPESRPSAAPAPAPAPASTGIKINSFEMRFTSADGTQLPDSPDADALRRISMLISYTNSGAPSSRELSCRLIRADGTTVADHTRCSRPGCTAHASVRFDSGQGRASLDANIHRPLAPGMYRYELLLADKKLYAKNFEVKAPAPSPSAPQSERQPFTLSQVRLANADFNYNTLSDFGDPMHEADMRFLCVRFRHDGLTAPAPKTLKFRIKRSDGTLLRAKPSDTFTHTVTIPLTPGKTQRVLIYGNRERSVFRAGVYRLEIFDGSGAMIHAMMFTIHPGTSSK